MLLFPPKNLCLCSKLWIRKDFLKFYMMEETYMLTQCNTMLMDFFFFKKNCLLGQMVIFSRNMTQVVLTNNHC